MKKILLLALLIPSLIISQTILLEENFSYTPGTLLTANGWTSYSGSGTNPIVIESGGLSFLGYPSSNIGNSVVVDNDGEDGYISLTSSQTAGTIYYSFLVKVSGATTAAAGDYFIGLGSTSAGTVAGRVFLKKSGSNFAFGLSKTTGTTTFTDFIYSFNTTYLIVVKYIINSGTSNDDVVLYIFDSSIPEVEPGTATITQPRESTSDPANISVIVLRQNITTNIAQVDGIRVSNSWSTTPLPVELTSFKALVEKDKVKLNWSTATEVNNYGFEIERKCSNGDWKKIGFVQGHGNSNSPKNYTYVDQPLGDVTFKYRLKQVDFDGTFEYSHEVEVKLDEINQFVLEQNYPNPFNPTTTIRFSLPVAAEVSISVFNLLGERVAQLLNANLNEGYHEVTFDGSSLTSGIYFYQLKAGDFKATKKFIITK